MKKLLIPLLAVALCGGLFTTTTGCAPLAANGVYAGDKVLYDADLVIATSYDTVHNFVSWELTYRAALSKQPQIKVYADYLRVNYKTWHKAALSARNVYLSAKTSTNKDALSQALVVLRKAMAEAQQWLADANLTPEVPGL